MITLLKSYTANPTGKDNTIKSRAVMKLAGLSTDEKPLIKFKDIEIENGSSFIEIDTNKAYKYDEENNEWIEQVKGSNKDIIIENNTLLTYINEITGSGDNNLSDAIHTLAGGYGNITVDSIASKRLSTRDVVVSGTVIVESAFSGYKNLASVRFDNPQLLKLSSLSFNSCSDLTTVIGEYITELGSSVFNNCRVLKNITLPNLNKTDVKCFYNCLSLVDISLPKLQILKDQTFRDCTSLKTVKLASCTAFNGSSQFYSCNNLEDIYLPNEESVYSGAPWGAPSTCTIHYNTQFDENGEPILE